MQVCRVGLLSHETEGAIIVIPAKAGIQGFDGSDSFQKAVALDPGSDPG